MKNMQQELMASHIEQWSSSGLSKAAYCKKAEIPYQSFVYYANVKHKQVAKSGFVMIDKKLASIDRIELQLPNGCYNYLKVST